MALFTGRTATKEVDGNIERVLIPSGTVLNVAIAEALMQDADNYNAEHIKIVLHVTEGEYKGEMINHKLKINADKQNTKDKAIDFLLAYDANAKSELQKADAKGQNIMQNNVLSRALCGTRLAVEVDVWEIDGDDGSVRSGNHVTKIMPSQSDLAIMDAAPLAVNDGSASEGSEQDNNFNDDDIPF